jgi:hypothetical protein
MKLGMIVRVSSISEPTPQYGDAASGNVQRSSIPITQSFHLNDNDPFYSLTISFPVSHDHEGRLRILERTTRYWAQNLDTTDRKFWKLTMALLKMAVEPPKPIPNVNPTTRFV